MTNDVISDRCRNCVEDVVKKADVGLSNCMVGCKMGLGPLIQSANYLDLRIGQKLIHLLDPTRIK